MGDLSKLINISNVIETKLNQIGINNKAELTKIGSKEAFTRILTTDSTACINMLYAIEGAIEGVRWHCLSDDVKSQLKSFYNTAIKIYN